MKDNFLSESGLGSTYLLKIAIPYKTQHTRGGVMLLPKREAFISWGESPLSSAPEKRSSISVSTLARSYSLLETFHTLV